MANRIVSVQPLSGCRLQVSFADGLAGIYPVEPGKRGGVFLKLLDASVFNAVTINSDFGCVEWPGGIDLCPETMHQAMAENNASAETYQAVALHEESPSKPAISGGFKK